MANSGEDDVSSHEIDPGAVAIATAIAQEFARHRNRHTHSGRAVRVRQEVGIHRIRGYGLSGSSDDTRAMRTTDQNTEQMMELSLSLNRLYRTQAVQNEEMAQMKITIADLRRQLEEETDKRRKADGDNAVLREKVQNLECEVSRLRDEIRQDKDDIRGLLDREQARVFTD